MKRRSVRSKVGCAMAVAALCCLLGVPAVAFAADVAVPTEKDETVYVYATADGTVKRTEVSTILKNPEGADELSDATTLTELKGKDDETFTGSDGAITWNAGGSNVTYTGATSAAAPVSMRVSYTLDGQPIAPDELAGKSGRVTIRYDFENHASSTASVNGASQAIYTPFTCITALMLDGKTFKNVTVENGKVVTDGDDVIVAGYAMPGLKQSLGSMAADADVPDHFTVSADATNFELKSTMTIVTAGLMSDLDTSSLGLGDLDDASALTDAMSQLISGSDTLATGLGELASNAKQLEAGMAELNEGVQGVSGGLALMASDAGLGQLSAGASSFSTGVAQISDAVAAMKAKLAEMKAAIDAKLPAADPFPTAQALVDKYKNQMEAEDYAALYAVIAGGTEMYGALQAVSTGVGEASTSVDALAGELEKAKGQAKALAGGAAEALDSAEQLAYGAGALEEGAAQLNAAMPTLIEALQAAADGSKTLTDGMRAFNDQGVSQLVDTLKNDYGGMLDRMNALSAAAKSYTNFAGITDGTAGSVKFVFEADPIGR